MEFHWYYHLFWQLGLLYWNFFTGKISSARENYYWIKIHICNDCKMVGSVKIPFKQRMKCYATALFGFQVSVTIMYLILEKLF